jgi:hypothetical protein
VSVRVSRLPCVIHKRPQQFLCWKAMLVLWWKYTHHMQIKTRWIRDHSPLNGLCQFSELYF